MIPLLLILASAGGIFFIVWRKLSFLQDLAQSDNSVSNFSIKQDWYKVVYDFCPEVWDWIKNIKIDEYKELWFVELEKFLRRLRLISLKMDRLSDSLIKKVRRRVYSNGNSIYAATKSKEINKNKSSNAIIQNNSEELKKAEQKLILEIARNPKSAILYEELGDLYAKTNDYRDAKEAYEAAVELNPQNEELNKKLSQALWELNKPEGTQN